MMWIWPVWLVALFLILGLGACFFCWNREKASRKGSWKDWTRRGLMVVAVASIGAAPSVALPREKTVRGANVFFVVDTTGSMNAEDYDGKKPRLEGVRADIRQIVSRIPNARYSIISFNSGATRELPITTDVAAVESWVQTVKPEQSSYSNGSSVYRPVKVLKRELERSRRSHPQSVQLVYVFSDGEPRGDKGQQKTYDQIRNLVDDGGVLGYGTAAGGPMKETTFSGTGSGTGSYIEDPQTRQTAISKIDEKELKAAAGQLKVNYMHRTAPGQTIDVPDVSKVEQRTSDGREERSPVLWPAGIALAVLAAWEIAATMPRIRLRVGRK